MFYSADSPSFEENSIMPENNNKGFDTANYGSDFYDMDSAEVSYTDLFTSSGQDQAVVSKVNTFIISVCYTNLYNNSLHAFSSY